MSSQSGLNSQQEKTVKLIINITEVIVIVARPELIFFLGCESFTFQCNFI
jgi:hypothetical protein